MTDKAQFRIGGVYRQRDGRLARLCPPIVIDSQGRALVHARCPRSGAGFGHRLAQTGMEWDPTMLERVRDLLPGELHQKDGEWVPVEEEKAVTFEDVKQRTLAVAKSLGRDFAIALLAGFGAGNASGLSNEDWAKYVSRADSWLGSKGTPLAVPRTPTLDKLENERDPQRPPLPYFAEKPADRWAGYVTKTSTTEQPRQSFLCDSPDLLPASHQLSPHFGSASLKG